MTDRCPVCGEGTSYYRALEGDRIEELLLARQDDIDTLGSELEIASRERDQARDALNEFRDGLTQALNDHGVPAMPTWREAIDWLAANGAKR